MDYPKDSWTLSRGSRLLYRLGKRVLTNLHKAVANNDIKTVRKYLSGPTSLTVGTVDSPNAEGQTPVHEAAKRGYTEMVVLLVEHKTRSLIEGL